MSGVIYPINDRKYTAEDVEIFNCTRTSGVFSVLDFDCSLSGNVVTIGKGLGWLKNSDFSGKAVAFKDITNLTLDGADSTFDRYDVVAVRYDTTKKDPEIVVIKGEASESPVIPKRSTESYLYELFLYSILRKAGESTASFENVTDLRENKNYCGIMEDSVTSAVAPVYETIVENTELKVNDKLDFDYEKYEYLIATLRMSFTDCDVILTKSSPVSSVSAIFLAFSGTDSVASDSSTFYFRAQIKLNPNSSTGHSVISAQWSNNPNFTALGDNATIVKIVGVTKQPKGYVAVDDVYNPESHNAQSGQAISMALSGVLEASKDYTRIYVEDNLGVVDVTYDPTSDNAQSGKAVAEALLGFTGGLNDTAVNLLIEVLQSAVYSDNVADKIASLKEALTSGGGDEPINPDEPVNPEATLYSVSATYSGGDVAVGTAVTDLTGIVVTATYSDGSTQTVTDYTLSGEITEGSNTITVSYGGKTTTFTVTGVAESGEATELTIRLGGIAQTFYTDEGNNIYSGSVGNRWISEKIAKVDTEVTIAILYGSNNNDLYQSVGCVTSDLSTEAYYVERIGYAQDTEYTYTYTVKAGYRLGIFNANGGSPNSITVTTTTPGDWEDVVNDNRFNGEYVVGMVSSGTGDINTAVTSCKTTDYIACADISEIYTFVISGGKKQHHLGIAFYNVDKQFISGANSIEPTKEFTPITVPDDAAYIRCSYGGAYGTNLPIYIGASANPDNATFVTFSTLIE